MMGDSQNIIYGLRDPTSGEIRYVGRSMSGLERPRAHFKENKKDTHKHRWIQKLKTAGLMYSVDTLSVVTDPSDLNAEERGWIAIGLVEGWPLTNATFGGEGSHGWHPSEETRRKISAAHQGRKATPAQRAAQSALQTGRKASAAHRKAISEGKTGTHRSAETKEKLRAINVGKKASDATKLKMSLTRKGKAPSEAHRMALSIALRGRKISPEVAKKSGDTQRGRKLSPERCQALRESFKHRAPMTPEHREKIRLALSTPEQKEARAQRLNARRDPITGRVGGRAAAKTTDIFDVIRADYLRALEDALSVEEQ